MKYKLPENHGLSDKIITSLVYTEKENPALTDAQYAALDCGLGRGHSVLVVSPTSTGKTQIAVWAIAHGIETLANTVYLVTHRALAQQKFHDFQELLLENYLDNDKSKIVLATGDSVTDGNGDSPADPLRVPLLVATYEKYLAMLSASGVPSSMSKTVVVCDEIQLLGDKNRGQNVEVLLTLLKNAGWLQFVGLSAVLEDKDSRDLSNWLNLILVRETVREKELHYEYWSTSGIQKVSTSQPRQINHLPLPSGVQIETLAVIKYLEKQKAPPLPIIVFCMRKQDVFDLVELDLRVREGVRGLQLPLDLGGISETATNSLLANALAYRIAIHSADLTDEERKIVEERLKDNKIDVVYATSTLAAGVNFPLGAAIFHKWTRWDGDQRASLPIDQSEFHNMAGRVGRMGSGHKAGRVIFFPETGGYGSAYRQYLELDTLPPIECRINVNSFEQLSLQLISSGLCHNRLSVKELINGSFSGLREQDNNLESFSLWSLKIDEAINKLINFSMVVEMGGGRLLATPFGKAVGHSGFRPTSAESIANYFIRKGIVLSDLLDDYQDFNKIDRFSYLIFSACFSSPEFRPHNGIQPSRFLPWPLKDLPSDASQYQDDLFETSWFADTVPTSAAQMSLEWINGTRLIDQENSHSQLRAGMLLEMYRNLKWTLQGFTLILTALSDSTTPDPLRLTNLRENKNLLDALRKLPRAITRLGLRVSTGLPDEVLWMNSLNQQGEPFQLIRDEILKLRESGLTQPEKVMLGTKELDELRLAIFEKVTPSPNAKANWLRDRCRSWKSDQRIMAAKRHKERARGCQQINLIDRFYESRGDAFEKAFEEILTHIGVIFERLDSKSVTGAPDYLIKLKNSQPLIFELKSKLGENLVNYNQATEVLAAAEIHGYRNTFCVTLCHPGVDPSVPMAITGCGRLSVVESSDLGEGLLRLCQRRLTQEQLWQWLATPGQALSSDLPYTEHL
jgi:helicase